MFAFNAARRDTTTVMTDLYLWRPTTTTIVLYHSTRGSWTWQINIGRGSGGRGPLMPLMD